MLVERDIKGITFLTGREWYSKEFFHAPISEIFKKNKHVGEYNGYQVAFASKDDAKECFIKHPEAKVVFATGEEYAKKTIFGRKKEDKIYYAYYCKNPKTGCIEDGFTSNPETVLWFRIIVR